MTNLWKAIFLEVIYREWCAAHGQPFTNRELRAAYGRAYSSNRFTFTVEA